MTNRKTTLVRGYMRRMMSVAKMAAEMESMSTAYTREFGGDITDDAVEIMSGDKLAALVDQMRADSLPTGVDPSAAARLAALPDVTVTHYDPPPSREARIMMIADGEDPDA